MLPQVTISVSVPGIEGCHFAVARSEGDPSAPTPAATVPARIDPAARGLGASESFNTYLPSPSAEITLNLTDYRR